MNTSLTNKDGESGFLDSLLILSQNLRLLVIGPLTVAAVVLGILFALPPRFTSQAMVAFPIGAVSGSLPGYSATITAPQAAALMKSAAVLDPALLLLNSGSNNRGDMARDALAANILIAVARDGLIRIDVTAPTALEAQNTANLLIDAWLHTTKPGAQQQAELEKRLARTREALSATEAIAATQKTALSSMAGLRELMDRYRAQIHDIERAMNGLSRDVVIQAPTLANRPTERPYIATFFKVMFGAELFFLMWVLGRHALETAVRNPETAQKLGRIRGSLYLFRRKRNPEREKSSNTEETQ